MVEGQRGRAVCVSASPQLVMVPETGELQH